MNQDDQQKPAVEAHLGRPQRHLERLRDAKHFHTKNLFGFWFLLVIGVCVAIFVIIFREAFSLLVPISILLVLLVVLTGAYAFQEVARIHKRIDAILNLMEEEERK